MTTNEQIQKQNEAACVSVALKDRDLPTEELMSLKDNFFQRVKVCEKTGCWIWQGMTAKRYGRMRAFGIMRPATHVSMFLHNGSFPKNLACHKCDNPPCVNPDHLFDGTTIDNARDMVNKKRHAGVFFKHNGEWLNMSQIARGAGIKQHVLRFCLLEQRLGVEEALEAIKKRTVRQKGGFVDHICENCGIKHKVKPFTLKRGWGRTCSRSCGNDLRAKGKNL